jgi:sulfite reductase alpha subunit-like flavoprotein
VETIVRTLRFICETAQRCPSQSALPDDVVHPLTPPHVAPTCRLNKSLSKFQFSNVRFALFCLGDRAYGPQFCAAGRKLAARLVQLGATPWCEVGYGDDASPNGGVFGDLDLWLEESFLRILPKREVIKVSAPISPYSVKLLKTTAEDDSKQFDAFRSSGCPMTAYSYLVDGKSSTRTPLEGKVISNDRITDASWKQDTRHISIQVDELHGNAPFLAGDILSLVPSNSNESVNKLLRVLPPSIQSMMDSPIQVIYDSKNTVPWPEQCTLRGLITRCADIQALPEREDLRALSFFCVDPEQAAKLVSLSEASGAALYTDYILREKRTWADVFHDFDSAVLTVETLLLLLPPIRPRQFSIASAPSQIVDLCVAVVEGKTPLGRSYQGLCSTYLRDLAVGDLVHLWISPGSFGRLPLALTPSTSHFETPILCIGAGTGVAPLRGLIQERERVRSVVHGGNVEEVGMMATCPDNILVFGCRRESMDFYYKDEWTALVASRHLSLHTAFSQDQWHKMYVQQVVRDARGGSLIAEHILEHHGAVFIAGGAKMARAVKDEIIECLAKVVGGVKQAQGVLKTMQRQGKFAVEAWS